MRKLVFKIAGIDLFRIPFPEKILPDNEGTFVPNELDKRLRKTRIQYMIDIVNICGKLPNMEFKSVLEELENFEKNLEYLEKEVNITGRPRK